MFQKPILVLTVCCLVVSCSYMPAEPPSGQGYILEDHNSYIVLKPSANDTAQTAMMFYPGGLVEPYAYVNPLAEVVRKQHRRVVILKPSNHLAIFNGNLARRVKNRLDWKDKNWVIAGHSLGGVVAAMAVNKEPDDYQALVLMASYASVDLSDWDKPLLVLTGSHDEVFDESQIGDNSENMPPLTRINSEQEFDNVEGGQSLWYDIEGGNHSQFADYGLQSGDGEAGISPEAQYQEMAKVLQLFFTKNQLR